MGVTHGLTYFGGCPGACPLAGGNGNANGVIDEPAIYTGNGQPRQVAQGGLLGSAQEALGDTANNWSFNFDPVGSGGIGRYLYIGSESKFRGLNVILQAAGVGVAAGDLDWEYWNGTSWTNLETTPGFTDGTNSFTKAGTMFWTADPAGWAFYPVDGGPLLFFVRAHLKATSAGYSSYPQERLIKTDILLLNYCADVTLNNQTFDISAPVPTAVDMLSFTAEPRPEAVDLAWETASEIHNLGFHLYRAEDVAGPYERITTSLIPGLGSSPTGARYSYRDGSLANGTTYYYRLEDWDTSGATKPHGPVWATPGTETSAGAGGAGPGEGSGVSQLDYGDATGNSLRILERGPHHVVLELLTSGFTARSDTSGTVRLSVPGFDDPEDPQAPALPLRRLLVDAPAGRRARIASVEPSDLQTFDGFHLSGTGTRVVEISETGILRPGRIPRPTAGAATRGGFFPRHYARIMGSAFQGETKKLRLELAPLRHDVAGGRTVLARRLVVRVEFYGKERGESTLGGSRGRRPALPLLKAKGVVVQLVLRGPGLHRVTFEDLFGTGRRGVPVSDLRLSHRDVDVAYHVEPPRTLFGPGSALYFVASPAENPHGETVYELATGRRGTVMPQVNAAPGGPGVTEARATLAFEQNKYYQAALLEAPDLWLWDLLVSPVAKTYPFTVTRPAPSSTASSLRVVLQGASDFEAEVDHHLRLSVNGSLVAETTWGGRTPTTVEATLLPGLLVEGSNVLEIENVGDTPAAYSMVFLNRFEVSYPRRLEAEGGRFEALFEEGGRAEVAGLSASAHVVETTSMSWLTGASSRPGRARLPGRSRAGATWPWTKRRCSRRRCEAPPDRGFVRPRTAPTGSCSALAPSWPKPALSWSCAVARGSSRRRWRSRTSTPSSATASLRRSRSGGSSSTPSRAGASPRFATSSSWATAPTTRRTTWARACGTACPPPWCRPATCGPPPIPPWPPSTGRTWCPTSLWDDCRRRTKPRPESWWRSSWPSRPQAATSRAPPCSWPTTRTSRAISRRTRTTSPPQCSARERSRRSMCAIWVRRPGTP